MAPVPFRVTRRRRELRDTWTLELEPVAGDALVVAPGQFTMLYAFGVGEVPISVSRADAGGPLVHTVRAVGRSLRRSAPSRPGAVLGRARAFRKHVARRGGRDQRCRDRRGRDRPRAASPGRLRGSPAARRVRRGGPALRQPHACRPAVPRGAPAAARPVRSPGRRHRRQRRGRLAGQGRRRAQADRGRPVRSVVDRGVRLRAGDHDALRGARASRARGRSRIASTCRWSATCAAASVTAATASSARR